MVLEELSLQSLLAAVDADPAIRTDAVPRFGLGGLNVDVVLLHPVPTLVHAVPALLVLLALPLLQTNRK